MKKLVLMIFMVTAAFIWCGFDSKSVVATTGNKPGADFSATNLTGANLTGANLTGANLEGVILDGVILCNTTMPDGSLNSASCKN